MAWEPAKIQIRLHIRAVIWVSSPEEAPGDWLSTKVPGWLVIHKGPRVIGYPQRSQGDWLSTKLPRWLVIYKAPRVIGYPQSSQGDCFPQSSQSDWLSIKLSGWLVIHKAPRVIGYPQRSQQKTNWWYCFLFFSENRIWLFMQIISYGDNLHEMSSPIFCEK